MRWEDYKGHGFLSTPAVTPSINTAVLVRAMKAPATRSGFAQLVWFFFSLMQCMKGNFKS